LLCWILVAELCFTGSIFSSPKKYYLNIFNVILSSKPVEEIKYEDLYLKMEKLLTLFIDKVKVKADENI